MSFDPRSAWAASDRQWLPLSWAQHSSSRVPSGEQGESLCHVPPRILYPWGRILRIHRDRNKRQPSWHQVIENRAEGLLPVVTHWSGYWCIPSSQLHWSRWRTSTRISQCGRVTSKEHGGTPGPSICRSWRIPSSFGRSIRKAARECA